VDDATIHRANIENYRKLLAQTRDRAKRQAILKLLEEEREKMLVSRPKPKRA
jgi:hypothetical protein